MHRRTRPPLAETMANLEIFEIGLQTGAHLHVTHLSLAHGFALLEMFRGMDMQVSGEACIQWLCMTEDDLVRFGGGGKCNPPFRTAAEVELMWTTLTEDKISCVPTDHSLWPLARKTLPEIFACCGTGGHAEFCP
jgi:allantoinase